MSEIEEENNTSVKELKSQCEKVRGNKHPLYEETWADYADRNGITYNPDEEKSCRSYLDSYEKWYYATPENENNNNNSGNGGDEGNNQGEGNGGENQEGKKSQSSTSNQNNENQGNSSNQQEDNSGQNSNSNQQENSETNRQEKNHQSSSENQGNNNNQKENNETNSQDQTDEKGKASLQDIDVQEKNESMNHSTQDEKCLFKKTEKTSVKYYREEEGILIPIDVHEKVADLKEKTSLHTKEIKETPQDKNKINTLRGITPSRQEQQQPNNPGTLSQEVIQAYQEKKLLESKR